MDRHKRFQEMVAARHALEPEERHEVDTHLSTCRSCRELATAYEYQDVRLRSRTLPPVPGETWGEVYRRIDARRGGKWRKWRGLFSRPQSWIGAVMATTAAGLVVLAALVHAHAVQLPMENGGRDLSRKPAMLATPPHVSVGTGHATTVVATSHGVRVSLTIPKERYVFNALAQFTVTVQNVSDANRYLQDVQPDWGGPFSPHIVMRNDAGKLLYEEDLSRFLAPSPGSFGGNLVLRPGDRRTWRVQFVLQSATVQAVTRVADGYTSVRGSGPQTLPPPRSMWAKHLWQVRSPWVHLSLGREQAPAAVVKRKGDSLHVAIRAPWPTTGPMYYMDSARCWTGPGTMSTPQHVPWTRTHGNSFTTPLTPHCPSPQSWRAVVGWHGHRVLFLSYPDTATISGRPR